MAYAKCTSKASARFILKSPILKMELGGQGSLSTRKGMENLVCDKCASKDSFMYPLIFKIICFEVSLFSNGLCLVCCQCTLRASAKFILKSPILKTEYEADKEV